MTARHAKVSHASTSIPAPFHPQILQRKCACGQHAILGSECAECIKKKQTLQRASLSPRGRGIEGEGEVPRIVHEVLSSPGQQLDSATRAFMEPRFGHDFSRVRVHTDANAAESAHAVNALAYTVGRDLVFGVGQYAPGTTNGKRLLAYELTHVAQQVGGVQPVLVMGESGDKYEQEAQQVAQVVVQREQQIGLSEAGKGFHWAPEQVQREEGPETSKTKFKPVEGKEAEEEFDKRRTKYKKEGKTEQDAAFLAMDDMFAERVKATGGQRFPGTGTPGTPGEKSFLQVSSGIVIEGKSVKEGLFNAGIDDKDYNCHSFTFTAAKDSKLGKLKTLAKTIPKEGGKLAGQKYYEAKDLVTEGIHFEITPSTLLFPRWVLDREARSYLKAFPPIKAGDKAVKGDVAVYSTNGDLPHSGKVTRVDASGNPLGIKGKWGHYSLFEHAPEAVPAHYGKPSYFRRK